MRNTKIKFNKCACKAFKSESEIIDWIFEEGDLDFIPKEQVNEFIKDRFNRSLESIGVPKVFETDPDLLKDTEWFNDEIIGTKHGDFSKIYKYSKRTKVQQLTTFLTWKYKQNRK